MQYIIVFLEFFKIGLFAIGGGLATLPFLYDLTEKYEWFTAHDLSNMIAISESTPGPIGVNCATYAGVDALGTFGGIISTFGLVLPSLIIILLVAKAMEKFKNNKFVNYGFYGIRPAVAALIALAFVDVAKTTLFNFELLGKGNFLNIGSVILFVIMFFLTNKFKKVHPIVFIGISALVGILFKF
ncbi:MAG: chromate transporter [Clostridia bacterium]|nr:chromate transporter [Clostridia bacterium]